jgi:hypothetical protein
MGVEELHYAFNNTISIKDSSITKLAKCILLEQPIFEIDIERLCAGEQPKKRKKVYVNLDARLKRITLSYNFNNIEQYLIRFAINLKISI